MVVISEGARNLQQLRANLGPWLREKWLDGRRAEVTDVAAFGTGGVSNETLRVRFLEAGRRDEADVVLRFPPAGRGVFPTYDLEREHRILHGLHSAGIPVAAPAVFEPDPSWLGEPFLAMTFVAGRVPASQPRPYVVDGWLKDSSPQHQSRVLLGFTDLLAALHRIDPLALGIEPLGPEHGGSPLRRTICWWLDYLEWIEEDSDAAQYADVRACYDWLLEHVPADEPPATFVWGDARLGNVAFTGNGAVSAAMDWESATIAPAEIDLGLHFAHRLNMGAMIGVPELPELPGFPTVDEQLARYRARSRRPVADLQWYTVFGAAGLAANRVAVQRASAVAGLPGLPGDAVRPWVKQIMQTTGRNT